MQNNKKDVLDTEMQESQVTFNGGTNKITYDQDFRDSAALLNDYTQAVTSLEFSLFKIKSDSYDGAGCSSLMASSHVDGSVKIFKFNNFMELSTKHRECRPDFAFKDHFYSAN